MSQSVDLDTLHHILKQYSDDVLNDSSWIILKLLDSVNGNEVGQNLRIFTSIKVLLNLYKKLCENSCETNIKFPVNLLIKNIKTALMQFNDDSCDLEKNIQTQILCILSSLYRIPCVGNCSEAVEELAELYDYCMTCLEAAIGEKGCKQDSLIFKLKLVLTVYDLLRGSTCSITTIQFRETSKSKNECQVLTKLVVDGNNDVAIQTLLFLVPGYTDCFKSNQVLVAIWEEISNSVSNSSVNYLRAMLVLCNFLNEYSDGNVVEKEFFGGHLFGDANYWLLVRSALVGNDPMVRKLGMHVFKKTVEALQSTTRTITCSRENISIFHWDSNSSDELHKLYSEIITILEYLDEQQIHIIKPIFKVAEALLCKVQECDKVSPYWVFVVCHKALIHDNIEVLKWGLTNLLLSSAAYFQRKNQEDIARQTVALLVPKLNTPALYYSDGLAVSEMLKSFFDKIAPLVNARVFFCLLIKEVCSLTWSPESLFFVVHAISSFSSGLGKTFWWGEDEIAHIRTFVLKAFKTYNKIIAVGIQCELLRAVTKLTDLSNVPLKSVLLLLSSFSFVEAPTRDCKIWRTVVDWLGYYSHVQAEQILESYKRHELGQEFNERSASTMFILLYRVFNNKSSNPVRNYLSDMLLLFKDIERRPYCQKELYDEYLSVIDHILKANAAHPIKGMLAIVLPVMEDVMAYVRSQLKQVSGLQDYSSCQLYLSAFENICKVRKLSAVEPTNIDSIYAEAISDLETSLRSDSESSPVGLYCRVRFLSLLLELHPIKQNVLVSYFLTEVNTPLEKNKSHREQTKDMQVLWGRINSEFIEAKWRILDYFIGKKLITPGVDQSWCAISDSELTKLCAQGLHSGGYEVLRPVMSVFGRVLPAMTDRSQAAEIIAAVWNLMMERRKTDEFKSYGKAFVEMLFQKAFILRGQWATEILTEYADKIFSTPSMALVNILMRHVQLIDLADSSKSLFCHIIGKALIFGPVQRRDEKLTTRVCSHIESFQICPVWKTGSKTASGQGNGSQTGCPKGVQQPEKCSQKKLGSKTASGQGNGSQTGCPKGVQQPEKYSQKKPGSKTASGQGNGSQTGCPEGVQQPEEYFCPEKPGDHFTSNEVRARAVERILTLREDSPRDRAIAKTLMASLIKMEGEVGGNRERYFGDSYVHRAKHRAMQALLLLEPVLSEEKDRKELLDWLYKGILMENPQPSVRYQKEWLLIKMLTEEEQWTDTLYDRLKNFDEFKSRGLCSLIVVHFHVSGSLPDKFETPYDDICALVPLLMHQHVEVRLHAQVFIGYHYDRICEKTHYESSSYVWDDLYDALYKVSEVMREQGLKSFLKLEQDFFIHSFDPFGHYSLETIYSELPKLAGVGSDEWVSTELLRYCGVNPSEISIPLENSRGSLRQDALQHEAFRMTDSNPEGKILKEMMENYQKKIIPNKITPHLGEKEGGLVVVASLIDRVPNLGGLARTCEIFGVSQYVIGSLRYIEDKQFTSLSVTAEKWIALKEVKASNLKSYLLEMKQNGYTVIGAEQTLHSQQLSRVEFPKKTLLLLGNEKEGIPPGLLPLLDICVEIPQMGIIRSLNVHVTGALFIWEYAKQYNFPLDV